MENSQWNRIQTHEDVRHREVDKKVVGGACSERFVAHECSYHERIANNSQRGGGG